MIVDISLYAEWKSTEIYALLPIQRDFRSGADLCKSDKQYLNAETCKLYTSFVHNFETFSILHVFPLINITKLQKLKYPC